MGELLLMSELESGLFFGIYLVYLLFCTMLPIVMYVFQSLGLYAMAQKRGLKRPWLAWVPVGDCWILGSLADQYRYVAKGEVKNRRKILMALYIVLYALLIVFFAFFIYFLITAISGSIGGYIPEELLYESLGAAFGMLGIALLMLGVAIVWVVFLYIALYDLYKSCDPNNATLFLALSIFCSPTMPFLIFFLRSKEGGMPPRREVIPEA